MWWPPNTPYFNPMNYLVSSADERDTNRNTCKGNDDLLNQITVIFANLTKGVVEKASVRFRWRFDADRRRVYRGSRTPQIYNYRWKMERQPPTNRRPNEWPSIFPPST